MKVVIAGGTGFTGTALSRELADRGHEVVALSRTPADADLPADVSVAVGDVTDYDSIAPALDGADAVVNLVALTPLFKPKGGEESHYRVHLGGTENVVRAAEERGVDRVVQLSAFGADPHGPTAYIRAKGRAEAVVRSSDRDWVIVRPSIVFGEGGEFLRFVRLLTTPYVTALPGGGVRPRFQPIWIAEYVPLLADAVERDEHAGETYEIGGPEPLTLADVTRALYRAEGKPVTIVPVPMALTRIGFTLAGPIPFVPFGPDQARSLSFDNATVRNDVRAFGVEPAALTTLGEYLGSRRSPDGGSTRRTRG